MPALSRQSRHCLGRDVSAGFPTLPVTYIDTEFKQTLIGGIVKRYIVDFHISVNSKINKNAPYINTLITSSSDIKTKIIGKKVEVGFYRFYWILIIKKENINFLQLFMDYKLRVIPSLYRCLQSIISRGKEKTVTLDQTNFLYRIKCQQCPSVHVDQTKPALAVRKNEHQNNELPDFVMNVHKNKYNHMFDWQNADIIY